MSRQPVPPYFQFFPRDFLDGVIALSAAERGGYISLLCHQWTARSVPGDDVAALGRIMGTRSKTDAKTIWKKIAKKFDRANDGTWTNARLELIRADVDRYFAAQKAKAAKGGRPRKENPRDIPRETPGEPPANPRGIPNETHPKPNVPSSIDRPLRTGSVETVETVENLRGIVAPISIKESDLVQAVWNREHVYGDQCPHDPACLTIAECIDTLAMAIAIAYYQLRKTAS